MLCTAIASAMIGPMLVKEENATCILARLDGACQKCFVLCCFGLGVCEAPCEAASRKDVCTIESLLHGAQNMDTCHLAAG